ncbi:kunitz-type protease inhibitor 2 [Cololabis saira]|uniref:kunitz-type protease inhibitor 2 n=1 Tax=Cololabis saira TaxID=129043 RepID=UPI002AD21E68|nr:kunitz-type protease inhibitor 2 [Cololabis saira]
MFGFQVFTLLVLVLVRSGLAQTQNQDLTQVPDPDLNQNQTQTPDPVCSWDQALAPGQGLAPRSLVAGARLLDEERAVPDAARCRALCCALPRCDLALLGLPADGGPQCLLVSCPGDACALQPSDQFQAYRRARAQPREHAQGGGNAPHVVPLMGGPGGARDSWGPRGPRDNGTDRCLLPSRVGPCRAAFPRFFYNVSSSSCSSFTYGGCDANANNFLSMDECEEACSGVTGSVLPEVSSPVAVKAPRMVPEGPADPANIKQMEADEFAERCGAEPQVGPCRAAFRRWYHNKDSGSCQSFLYGGCKGNRNNYDTEDECKDTCTGVSVLPPSEKTSRGDDTGICGLKPESGPCRAAFTKFYYDSGSASCRPFLYGGCQGNDNKFNSEDECMNRCSGDGWYDSRAKTIKRWTAGSFLFVTLAAVSALLLATLFVFTLRRRGAYRRASTHSDKEELLPEDQSSMDLDQDSPGPGLKA